MRISVIIPCYNSGHLLHATLDSVLRQTVSPFEILFLDDGSTDDTWSRLEGFQSRHRELIRIFRWPENIGNEMRTELIKHAQGDWIANLDHDDLWMPTKLERQIEAHRKQPKAEVIHTDGWNQPGELIRARQLQPRPTYRGPSDPHEALFFANFILASSAIYPKALFSRVRGPETYKYPLIGDYEFWLRASRLNAGFVRVPEALTVRRAYPTGQLGSRLLEHFRDAVVMFDDYERLNRSHRRIDEGRARRRVSKARLDLIVNLLMSPDARNHEEAGDLWIQFVRNDDLLQRYSKNMIRMMALARRPNPKAAPTDEFPEPRWRKLDPTSDEQRDLLEEWKRGCVSESGRQAIGEETAGLFRLGGVNPPFLGIYEAESNLIQKYTDEAWSSLENKDRQRRPFRLKRLWS